MQKLKYFIPLFLLALISCKSVTNYPISDTMKQYFDYHMGSYWIYKNDSTGDLDSTYVRSYNHTYGNQYNDDKHITEEAIEFDYHSSFLSQSYIAYVACGGPNYYTLSGNGEGGLVFSPNWPENTQVFPDCYHGAIFLSKTYSMDTIGNIPYQNVIYAELRTIDSSSTNPYRSVTKVYFAKHIGIIKYYAFYPYYKANYSFTLLSYKVIQ